MRMIYFKIVVIAQSVSECLVVVERLAVPFIRKISASVRLDTAFVSFIFGIFMDSDDSDAVHSKNL